MFFRRLVGALLRIFLREGVTCQSSTGVSSAHHKHLSSQSLKRSLLLIAILYRTSVGHMSQSQEERSSFSSTPSKFDIWEKTPSSFVQGARPLYFTSPYLGLGSRDPERFAQRVGGRRG